MQSYYWSKHALCGPNLNCTKWLAHIDWWGVCWLLLSFICAVNEHEQSTLTLITICLVNVCYLPFIFIYFTLSSSPPNTTATIIYWPFSRLLFNELNYFNLSNEAKKKWIYSKQSTFCTPWYKLIVITIRPFTTRRCIKTICNTNFVYNVNVQDSLVSPFSSYPSCCAIITALPVTLASISFTDVLCVCV